MFSFETLSNKSYESVYMHCQSCEGLATSVGLTLHVNIGLLKVHLWEIEEEEEEEEEEQEAILIYCNLCN